MQLFIPGSGAWHFTTRPTLLPAAALLLILAAVAAPAPAQTLSLTLRRAPLPEAFRQVEARTACRFVYVREDLTGTHPVTLKVEAAPLDSVLRLLFGGQPLTFDRQDGFILVRKSPPGMPPPPLAPTLRGQVVDEEGTPVGGATIQVAGSGRGAVADSTGHFFLSAPGRVRLLISAVGYQEAEVTARGTGILVTLRRLTPVLDETVVIGYGRTTRRRATGSVGKVHGRQLAHTPAATPLLQALQGRATGLYLRAASGLPDAPFTVRIRGQHSLMGGSSPLFVVDGVPVLLEGTALAGRSTLAALAPLHPTPGAEIESIEVLKDADATAIYGSRGAGGVVLITTRQPEQEGRKMSFTLTHSWSWAGRTVDYLSTPRYLRLRREAFQNDGEVPTPQNAPDLTVWDTARDQRWQKKLIGGTAPGLQAQLRLSDQRNGTAFGLSGTFVREATVFPGSFATTWTAVRAQATHKSPGGKLTLRGHLSGHGKHYRLPAQDLTIFAALPPNMYGPYDERGRLQWQEGGAGAGNPLAAAHQPYAAGLQQLSPGVALQYRPHPQLELSVLWGGHLLRFSEEMRYPIAAQDPARHPRGSLTYGHKKGFSSVWEPQARYTLTRGTRSRATLLGGATLQQVRWQGELLTAGGYSDDALLGSLAHAATLGARSEHTLYRYGGLYGRFTGEHEGKYLLQATLRRDGSSRFGPGRQFALFGAVGGGWLFTRERWFEPLRPLLPYGKLRTSFGSTGSDRIGEDAFREQWSPLPYPYAGTTAWRADRLYNPGFGWEVTRKWEAALELGLLKERLLLTASRYHHRSFNLVLRAPLPAQTGFTTVLANYPARVENRGWEGEVSLRSPSGRSFSWNITGQLTVPRNRLSAFEGLESTPYAATHQTGRPLDNFRGYGYLGVDPVSGLYRFEDRNGNGTLDGGDRAYTGTRDPAYYGSVQGGLGYRRWSLTALLYFVRQQGLHPVYSSGVAPGDRVNMPRGVEDRWPQALPSPAYQRATQSVLGEAYYPSTTRLAQSSAALTDASFLRLSTLHLAYRAIPRAGKEGLKEWRWFFSAQHLFTLTRYDGDPEVQSTSTLPLLRTVETGLTLTF